MKLSLAIAATAASAALLTPTLAEARGSDAETVVSESVHYGDLNLASEKDRARLDRRINAALERVCGDPGNRMLKVGAKARACIAAGKSRAAAQVAVAARAAKGSKVALAAR